MKPVRRAQRSNTPRKLLGGLLLSLCANSGSAQSVVVPSGYEVDVVASGPELSFITSIAFDGDGVLYAGEANIFTSSGRVLRIDETGVSEHASDLGLVLGLAFRADDADFPLARPADCAAPSSASSGPSPRALGPPGTELERIRRGDSAGRRLALYVSHFIPGPGGSGAISRLVDGDADGVAEERVDIVTDLPSDGENGNQQLAIGPTGDLYFGMGTRTNSGVPGTGPPDTPLNGTILRVAADGSDLFTYARGLRNANDLLFTPCGELLATENGPDASGTAPVFDAPDELNAIYEGAHYGWPDHHGFPEAGSGSLGPMAVFATSSSTNGLALVTPADFCGFEGDLIAAQFGSFSDPSVGRRLLRIELIGQRGVVVEPFATGFGRPLDVAFGPDGALYVADFSNAFFSPATAVIYRIRPTDSDGDGTPDICTVLAPLATRSSPAGSAASKRR